MARMHAQREKAEQEELEQHETYAAAALFALHEPRCPERLMERVFGALGLPEHTFAGLLAMRMRTHEHDLAESEAALVRALPDHHRSLALWLLLQACVVPSYVTMYDARARASLRRCAASLCQPHALPQLELALAQMIEQQASADATSSSASSSSSQSKLPWWQRPRTWAVAGATGLGGVACLATGGWAAPAVASGLHSIFGLSVSSTLLTSGFTAYGAREANKRTQHLVSDLTVFEFDNLKADDPARLASTIFAAGAVTTREEFHTQWHQCANASSEKCRSLVFEPEEMCRLYNVFERAISEAVMNEAFTAAVAQTFLKSLFYAMAAPMAVLSAFSWIDSTVSVVASRADQAGKELAHSLTKANVQGGKPVSLVGCGYGARALMTCLDHLSKEADGGGAGIVDTAVLCGLPFSARAEDWEAARSVVADRLVNCYSQSDWLLALCFRVTAFDRGCAGLQKVDREDVEDINVCDIIARHTDYASADKLRQIMARVEAGGSSLDEAGDSEAIAIDSELPKGDGASITTDGAAESEDVARE